MSCAGSVAVFHYMRYLDNGVITWRNVVFLTIKYPPLQTLHPPPHTHTSCSHSAASLSPPSSCSPPPPPIHTASQFSLLFAFPLPLISLSLLHSACIPPLFSSHSGCVCATVIWRGALLNVVVWVCHVFRCVPLFVMLSLSSETHHRHLTRACTVS